MYIHHLASDLTKYLIRCIHIFVKDKNLYYLQKYYLLYTTFNYIYIYGQVPLRTKLI